MGGFHIREVVKRLSMVVFLLRKLKSHIAKQYFVTAYYGLFHSHMNYNPMGPYSWMLGHAEAAKKGRSRNYM